MEDILDILKFIFAKKKYWLAPVLISLLLLGILLVIGGGSAAAPFIYSFF